MVALLALLACTASSQHPPVGEASTARTGSTAASSTPNILVIVIDDLGTEAMSCYPNHGVERAPQPNLARLCRNGVVFDRAWSNPLCSPTRASMLTGRDAWRHGVGEPRSGTQPGLSSDEVVLPAAMSAQETGHATALFGKWHLADEANGGNAHPNLAGFDRYAGAIDGEVPDFYDWDKVVDGESEGSTTYATTANVDDALEWVGEQDQPWMMWLSFNAPHWPYHLPPGDLHGYDDLADDEDEIDADPVPYFLSMVEAMDTEIGRLIDGIEREEMENTWVIVVGDNGTDRETNQDLFASDRAKGSMYEGGVHVPLVISGPELVGPGRREDAIVSVTDIFATVLELAGGDLSPVRSAGVELDSVSMLPYLVDPDVEDQRDLVYTAVFGPTVPRTHGGQAVFDGRYKLVRTISGDEELYDLQEDPTESRDLLERTLGFRATRAYTGLSEAIDERPIDTWWTD